MTSADADAVGRLVKPTEALSSVAAIRRGARALTQGGQFPPALGFHRLQMGPYPRREPHFLQHPTSGAKPLPRYAGPTSARAMICATLGAPRLRANVHLPQPLVLLFLRNRDPLDDAQVRS